MFEYLILTVLLPIIYKKKILTARATIVAGILGFSILYLTNVKWLILLISFLIISAIITKYRCDYKSKIFNECFSRDIPNVLANGIPGLIFALIYKFYPSDIVVYSYLSVLSALMADKASSEIGVLSKKNPIYIINLKPVPKGTNGAVTLLGEIAGIIFAGIIGMISYFIGLTQNLFITIIVSLVFGFLGSNIDSLLGALFENKGIMNKHHVNFLSGTISGISCLIILTAFSFSTC